MVTLTAPESTANTAPEARVPESTTVDLAVTSVRELNQAIHNAADGQAWTVTNPGGKHSLAVHHGDGGCGQAGVEGEDAHGPAPKAWAARVKGSVRPASLPGRSA